MTTNQPLTPHAVFGVAQHPSGRWFSLSEEAFSSGVVLYDTLEEAQRMDAQHHAFMLKHHPTAVGVAPYVDRA